jgi:hypothetical protein
LLRSASACLLTTEIERGGRDSICDETDPVPVPDKPMGCYARRTSVEICIAPGDTALRHRAEPNLNRAALTASEGSGRSGAIIRLRVVAGRSDAVDGEPHAVILAERDRLRGTGGPPIATLPRLRVAGENVTGGRTVSETITRWGVPAAW